MGSKGETKCMLCEDLIVFKDGDVLDFQNHMEYGHEATFGKEELLALTFLQENERKVLIERMMPRIQHFLEQGEPLSGDVFSVKDVKENSAEVQVNEMDEIQQLIDEDFSDSDDDDEFSSVEVKVKQPAPSSEIEEITIGDTDSENDENDENDTQTFEEQLIIKTEEDFVIEDPLDPKQANIDNNEPDNIVDDEQQEILQNVSCKLEIEYEEVGGAEENSSSENETDGINLAEKLMNMNYCKLCFSSFSNKGNLRKHEATVHINDQEALSKTFFTMKDLVYSCNMCPQIPGFLTENILITHKKLQHRVTVKNTTAKCETCNKVVKYHNLKGHMLTHSEQEKYECNLCYKKLSTPRNLQDHQKKVHSDDARFIGKQLTDDDLIFHCSLCSLKFVSDNILKCHQKIHEVKTNLMQRKGKTAFNCQYCTNSFENFKMFKIHCIKVHGKKPTIDGSQKKFQCILCYSGFTMSSYLIRHQKIHKEDQDAFKRTLNDSDLKFKCPDCEKKFVSRNILNYHTNKVHKELEYEYLRKSAFDEETMIFKCKLCFSAFQAFSSLHAHLVQTHQEDKHLLKTQIEESDRKYLCDECDLKFVTQAHMLIHKRSHETRKLEFLRKEAFIESENKFKCKFCYTVFLQFSNLKAHIGTVHKNEKEWLHRKINESDLKFSCDECDKKFLSESLVEYHAQYGHTTKRCKLCYKTFTKKRYLLNHEVTMHKNESEFLSRKLTEFDLKFSCTQCEKKFVTENLLRGHERKHKVESYEFLRKEAFDESTKMYKCKLCYKKLKDFGNLAFHINGFHKEEAEFLNRKLTDTDLKFGCSECKVRFVTNSILETHRKKHRGDKFEFLREGAYDELTKMFKCKLCYRELSNFGNMTSHIIRYHKKETEFLNRQLTDFDLKYVCSECNARFVSSSILETHRKKHVNEKFQFLRKDSYDESRKRFRCKLCYTEYKFFSNFVPHMGTVHKEESELVHRVIENHELIFNCGECKLKFVSENSMNFHTSKCHDAQITNHCKLCNLEFKTNSGFYQHKHRVHALELVAFRRDYKKEDLIFHCNSCESKFPTEISLKYHYTRRHQQKHGRNIGQKKIKSESQERYCQLCYILYKEPRFLKIHKKKVHSGEMDAFDKELNPNDMQEVCTRCSKAFYSKNTLEHHIRRKHGIPTNGSNAFSCNLCYISFPWKSVLEKHRKILHTGDMHLLDIKVEESMLIHSCNFCDKRFVAEHILKYHKKYQHKEASEKLTYCRLCYLNFKSNAHLKAHKKNIHSTKEEMDAFKVKLEKSSLLHACKFCSKRFLTMNILRHHNNYSHKEEKRQDLTCEFCNKVFKWNYGRKQVMKNHMKNVHNLQDYQVDQQEPARKENETVQNFMNLLNSLK